MSIKKNTIANYVGQIYISFIGIVILPFYLQYLGASAFGLVGFFTVMQAWLRLLDIGLTPTLSRQVANIRGGSQDYFALRQLVRSLEVIFLIISIMIFLLLWLGSNWIANHWLKVGNLSITTVAYCIALMGLMFAFRWLTDLYAGGIKGFEKQVVYNVISIFCVSLQYIGGWFFLHFITHSVERFFEYQVLVSGINLVFMGVVFYWLMPKSNRVGVRISPTQLKLIMPFALGLSYSSIVWILVTQSDKLVFSNILPLSQYGYYALLVVIASGVLQLSAPISQAILPRMTYLLSQGKKNEMLELYCKSSNYMCIIMFSTVGCIAIFAKPLLYAWTGDMAAAEWGCEILFWYVLASGVLSIAAFQYYLQYAHGSLRLHVWYNTLAAIIKVPLIIYIAYNYGVYATAVTWFILNVVIFIVWVPIVHHVYAKGINFRWFKNVIIICLITFVICFWLSSINIIFPVSRLLAMIIMICIGFGVLLSSYLISKIILRMNRVN